MSDPLPFAVSAEAEEWLSQIPLLPDGQPGITLTSRHIVVDGGEIVEKFMREHYDVIHNSPQAWVIFHAVQMVIGTQAFWILPRILDKLRGKTLETISADVSNDLDDPRVRTFLVAV